MFNIIAPLSLEKFYVVCLIQGWVENCSLVDTQSKEGILPVATLSIALYVLRRSMSASDVAPEVAILSSAL